MKHSSCFLLVFVSLSIYLICSATLIPGLGSNKQASSHFYKLLYKPKECKVICQEQFIRRYYGISNKINIEINCLIPNDNKHNNKVVGLNTKMTVHTNPTHKLNWSLQEHQINIYWPQLNIIWPITTSRVTTTTRTTTKTRDPGTTSTLTKEPQQQQNQQL